MAWSSLCGPTILYLYFETKKKVPTGRDQNDIILIGTRDHSPWVVILSLWLNISCFIGHWSTKFAAIRSSICLLLAFDKFHRGCGHQMHQIVVYIAFRGYKECSSFWRGRVVRILKIIVFHKEIGCMDGDDYEKCYEHGRGWWTGENFRYATTVNDDGPLVIGKRKPS